MEVVKDYRVILSCPADMLRERQLAEKAIQDYKRYIPTNDISYSVMHMGDVASQFGKPAQEIINEDFQKFDIYIGLMGAKFGSPTTSHGSGTEEEFLNAVESKKANQSLNVTFLFKNVQTAFTQFNSTGFDQAAKVLKFQESISNLGLYQTFATDDELVNQINLILRQHAIAVSQLEASDAYQYQFASEHPGETAFQVNANFFSDVLDSLDADITNNQKASITLTDIYVPLDLIPKDISGKSEEGGTPLVNLKELELGRSSGETRIILTGDESAGKTTAAKMAFRDFQRQGFVPVLIEGNQIKTAAPEKISKEIEKNFCIQYSKDALDRYRALEKGKKVLIVDNFEDAPLNAKHQIIMLDSLRASFDHLLVTFNAVPFLNLKTSAPNGFSVLSQFRTFELEDMGFKLRDELIQKWIRAGREESISDEVMFETTEKFRRIVDGILGTNFVPRKPFIILVLLQAIQSNSANDLTHSSFVRYYKFLIDETILTGAPQSKVELYYALLPEIAYAMFKSSDRKLPEKALDELVKAFADRKGIHTKDLLDVKSSLIFLDMLKSESGVLTFGHSYTYYFFLGQYFHDHMADPSIKTEVKNICLSLNLKENANILIFTSYHSNDPIIIDSISSVVDGLFEGMPIFDFSTTASSALNKLVGRGPKIIVQQKEASKRDRALTVQDQVEKRRAKHTDDISQEELDGMEFGAHANLAYRSAEILGQLLKNHHVRFDAGPKREIYKRAVNVGLRCLNVLIEALADDSDGLVAMVEKFNEKIDKEEDRVEVTRMARKAIFDLCYRIIFSFVKTTSNFTGADTLSRTYEDVLAECNQTIYKLIDLSIRMDFFEGFPMKELQGVASECKDNHLAIAILRNLVSYRLYMRPLEDYQKKQKICQAVGITMQEQLRIESKSEKKSAQKDVA